MSLSKVRTSAIAGLLPMAVLLPGCAARAQAVDPAVVVPAIAVSEPEKQPEIVAIPEPLPLQDN